MYYSKQNLAKLNQCNRIFNLNPLNALSNYAYWLTEFDRLLLNELKLSNFSSTADHLTTVDRRNIIDFCFERGMNANKMTPSEAIQHMKSRLEFTNMLSKTTDHSNLNVLFVFELNASFHSLYPGLKRHLRSQNIKSLFLVGVLHRINQKILSNKK